MADDPTDCVKEEEQQQCETTDETNDSPISSISGGPEQVENRLDIDSNRVTPMFPKDFARGYFDWKDSVKKNKGVGFGSDYSFGYLSSSDSPGEDKDVLLVHSQTVSLFNSVIIRS